MLRGELEAEMVEAARGAALRVVRAQRSSASVAPDLLRAREGALSSASAAELSHEVRLLWSSILAADVLLAGPLRSVEAGMLLDELRAQLRPVLKPGGSPTATLLPAAPVELEKGAMVAGLTGWEPLLYRPAYEPRPLAQNLCLEPALAATLDECGAL